MFRKIVSQLSFSPALVGQLGFYARRLRKEEATRRLGLIFVALALVVQSLVVFQGPESANASNANDFVPGGLGLGANRSLDNFLRPYDANTNHLQDIMTSAGVTRAEIASAQFGSFIAGEKYSWGRETRPGSTDFTVRNAAGEAVTTVYARKLSSFSSTDTRYYGWIGHSASVGWFAILQACGNLVTDYIPTPPPPPTPPPAPEPEPAEITLSKEAVNISQGNVDAAKTIAQVNDRIKFTLTVKNTGGSAETVELKDYVGDTLEYAKLVDKGGGTYDEDKRLLSWPDISVAPGTTDTLIFAVQILSSIPAMPTGQSDTSSYNCVIENVFGEDSVSIPVSCAPPKVVEEIVTELPTTGPTENMIFGSLLLAIVSYFFFRSKQLGKEVRLIRRNLHAGNI